ncbi:Imm8 family immunity protein [Nonomuraea sp. NPDC049655]|uniref:Imm8 family immunity protein n=1 Tax=Nonomuraea sp. NPDC049655 TaxID=3364355 RepID=UPI0037A7F8C0
MGGVIDQPGEEQFQLTVCAPSALAEQLEQRPFLMGRPWLFVAGLRPEKVTEWLSERIAVLEAPAWQSRSAGLRRQPRLGVRAAGR